ncbi:MAG: DUF6057 family protein, partial [Planctomycetia bacterium]|nr:DUF6057 family protein [Planctomycetia bacterium]
MKTLNSGRLVNVVRWRGERSTQRIRTDRERKTPTAKKMTTELRGTPEKKRTEDPEPEFRRWIRPWIPTAGISIAFFLFFWWLLSVRFGNLLYLAQNGTLFLNTTSFLREQCAPIAGTLDCATRFLLQTGVYPGLCGAAMAAMAVGSGIWIIRFCGIRGMAEPIAFLPACLWMIALPAMREYLFEFVTLIRPFRLMPGILGALLIAGLVEWVRDRGAN